MIVIISLIFLRICIIHALLRCEHFWHCWFANQMYIDVMTCTWIIWRHMNSCKGGSYSEVCCRVIYILHIMTFEGTQLIETSVASARTSCSTLFCWFSWPKKEDTSEHDLIIDYSVKFSDRIRLRVNITVRASEFIMQ